MAYDYNEMLAKALKVIPEEQCVTVEELVLYMPCGKTTFYALKLNEANEIKSAIEDEKVKVKKKLRRRWRDSDNPALQIAEYKLISSDDEFNRLNTQRINTNLTVNKPGISLTIGAEQDDNG